MFKIFCKGVWVYAPNNQAKDEIISLLSRFGYFDVKVEVDEQTNLDNICGRTARVVSIPSKDGLSSAYYAILAKHGFETP